MKTIKLQISQLGRLRNSEVEITPWMIFSGESGLGKSYLSILIHYFFEVLVDMKRIDSFIREIGVDYNTLIPTLRNTGIAFYIKREDFERWLAEDAIRYTKYMINNDDLNADIRVILPNDVAEIMEFK